LRLNLADIFLPFIGLFILSSIISKRTKLPIFPVKHIYLWLIILSALFFAGLFNAFLTYGELNKWAVTNKFCGWFVLTAYFLMGAWLIQNSNCRTFDNYLKITFYFCFLVTVISLLAAIMLHYGWVIDNFNNNIPMEGLMANKNAYILWVLCLLGLGTLLSPKVISLKIICFFWFLLPMTFIFTGARAGYIAFALILPFLIYFNGFKHMTRPIIAFILGILPLIIIANTAPLRINSLHWVQFDFIDHFGDAISGHSVEELDKAMSHNGDSLRLRLIYFAKDMIEQRPIIGNGLGSSVFEQEKEWGSFVNVIDSTPLWVAAEFGVLGLCIFLAFYFILLKYFWQNQQSKSDPFYQKLCQSIFLMMILFAIMSVFHEIFYTRFMWFFIGLGLAYPVLSKSDKSASSETS
jgi:hypothetical protein